MAAWVCQDGPKTLLDPALGRGVFVDAVAGLTKRGVLRRTPRIDAFEIDDFLVERLVHPIDVEMRVRRQDFIRAATRSKYDAILANPPYIRHHQLDYGESVWRKFDRLCCGRPLAHREGSPSARLIAGPTKATGRGLSRMTNLYGLFLIKIWTLVAPGGRAAVITPAEWLNADFGTAIKAFFLQENALDGIVHFGHSANVFDGVLTTAAITLLRRGRAPDEPVRLLPVHDARRLAQASLAQAVPWRRRDLDPQGKWTPLFESGARPRKATGPVLGDIARCMRGIATGANGFFTLRASDLRRWRISRRDVAACITSADQIRSSAVTAWDVRRLIEGDERVFLLRPRRPLSKAVVKYLALGRKQGVHRRYLPSHRPVWYMPEAREPAPLLVSVFARGRFRFVWNRAGVLNLTAYHGIYPRGLAPLPVQRLVKYLCSAVAQRRLRRHCRIYADGLLKVEPRDVEKIPIPRSLLTQENRRQVKEGA